MSGLEAAVQALSLVLNVIQAIALAVIGSRSMRVRAGDRVLANREDRRAPPT